MQLAANKYLRMACLEGVALAMVCIRSCPLDDLDVIQASQILPHLFEPDAKQASNIG